VILRSEFREGLEDEDEWALGHYKLIYEPAFKTLKLQSEDRPEDGPGERRLRLQATGKVRVKLEENLVSVRATGSVLELTATMKATVMSESGAVQLVCASDIPVLDANFHNVNNILDKRLSSLLRRALGKSLRKSARKLSRKRFPAWIPFDTVIDIDFGPGQRSI